MGVVIRHAKSTKVVAVAERICLGKPIIEILSSDSWKGRRCFLLGGSPSMRSLDFDLIKDDLTIGINKAFIKFPTTINYAMDMGFFDKITYAQSNNSKSVELNQQWLNYKGIKLFLNRPKFKLDSSIYVVTDTQEKVLSFDLAKGIVGGNNSGFGALMLAIALGATKIGLLGYSMKVDKTHKRTHWHDGYEGQKFETMQSKLDKFKDYFISWASLIESAGIKVVNLDPNSALECFPKESLEYFLKNYSK